MLKIATLMVIGLLFPLSACTQIDIDWERLPLSDEGKTSFKKYLDSPYNKAFAIKPGAGARWKTWKTWGWNRVSAAKKGALTGCESNHGAPCELLAVNDDFVGKHLLLPIRSAVVPSKPVTLEEAKQITTSFEGQSFTPPRSSNDILDMLEEHKNNPENIVRRDRLLAILDETPPSNASPITLAKFYRNRGIEAYNLGRFKEAIDNYSIRHFPDNLQIESDDARIPPPWKRISFRSHPTA